MEDTLDLVVRQLPRQAFPFASDVVPQLSVDDPMAGPNLSSRTSSIACRSIRLHPSASAADRHERDVGEIQACLAVLDDAP
jgi:hypothetical protein